MFFDRFLKKIWQFRNIRDYLRSCDGFFEKSNQLAKAVNEKTQIFFTQIIFQFYQRFI